MSLPQRGGPDFTFAGFLVIAAFGALLWKNVPLESSRPTSETECWYEKEQEAIPARLWQDPFRPVYLHEPGEKSSQFLKVPYEWYRYDPPDAQIPVDKWILLLWLDESRFAERPLGRLRDVFGHLIDPEYNTTENAAESSVVITSQPGVPIIKNDSEQRKSEATNSSKAVPLDAEAAAVRRPAGTGQFDYLRRLAVEVKLRDRRSRLWSSSTLV